MSSLVMWSSSSSELSVLHCIGAPHTCPELCFARAFYGPGLLPPLQSRTQLQWHPHGHWGVVVGGWSVPLLERNLWACRPEFSLLSNQIIEQKQMPALCIFLSFFFFAGGLFRKNWCWRHSQRCCQNNQKPSEGSESQCQHPKRQPRFRKLKYLSRLDLEPFSADI